MYILIDLLNLLNSGVYTTKSKVIEKLKISRNTLNRSYSEKDDYYLYGRYLVLYKKVIDKNSKVEE